MVKCENTCIKSVMVKYVLELNARQNVYFFCKCTDYGISMNTSNLNQFDTVLISFIFHDRVRLLNTSNYLSQSGRTI